jgi:MFS family permease
VQTAQTRQLPAPRSIWSDPEFRKICGGRFVSSLGSSITNLALPLIAIESLHAGATEMGVLGAAGNAAFLLFGLFAGIIADRFRRKLVLVTTSFLAACVIAILPVASAIGSLRIELIYAIAFASGCLVVIDEVAFQAILPRLIGRERLISGNTVVRSTTAVTDLIGSSAAGAVIQVLTAPVAVVLDAVSFLAASFLTFLVRIDEPTPVRHARRHIWSEMSEGLRYIFMTPALRVIAVGGGTHNFFSNGTIVALYVLYATQALGQTPFELGVIFAAAGPAALVGALLASLSARRFGMRNTLTLSQALTGMARLLVPLAAVTRSPFLILLAGEFLLGLARSIFNVSQLSLRQAITPDHLQGRMSASIRFLMWGLVPLGALAGGWTAERIGLTATLTVAAFSTTAAALWFLLVPDGTTWKASPTIASTDEPSQRETS